MAFWQSCKAIYPRFFTGTRVLDVGSWDINGTPRPLFEGCEYVGVDWRPGPGVDVVSLAHEMEFDHRFDVVLSASLLEHDPFWELSVHRMIDFLEPHGALLLTWGGAENAIHGEECAPDGKFHPLPAGRLLSFLRGNEMYVERFLYEPQIQEDAEVGWGGCCLVAFHERSVGLGTSLVSELREGDRA